MKTDVIIVGAVKKFAFPRVSQIGISYRNNSLSENNESFDINEGDRMPYFEIDGASIYDRLREPKFHLLTFFDGGGAPDLPETLETGYAAFVDFHALPLYPNVAKIFGTDKTFSVLLRPDNYIATLSSDVTFETMENYLSNLS